MKEREDYKSILRSHNLRITQCRLDVLEFFSVGETGTITE